MRKSATLWEQIVIWVLIAFLLTMIWSFSAQPAEESSEMSGRFSRRIAECFFPDPTDMQYHFFEVLVRKTAHMTEYAILMLSLSYALAQTLEPHPNLWALLGVFLWAVSDELHQYFVPGRSCMVTDVLIDLMGAGFSIPIRWLIVLLFERSGKRIARNGTSRFPQ